MFEITPLNSKKKRKDRLGEKSFKFASNSFNDVRSKNCHFIILILCSKYASFLTKTIIIG